METHLLTVLQAANRAGVSESLVYEWCKRRLPHFRFGVNGKGGKIMIDPDEFDGFLASCKVTPGEGSDAEGEELTFLK